MQAKAFSMIEKVQLVLNKHMHETIKIYQNAFKYVAYRITGIIRKRKCSRIGNFF